RWNIDPRTYPWQSSYAAFNNNPIVTIDPLGLEGDNVIESGEVQVPKGAKAEFSQGDITKGETNLPTFELDGGIDPTKIQSDNTYASVFVEPRSTSEQIRDNNNAVISNFLTNDSKLVGKLTGRNSPFSLNDKKTIFNNFTVNGPARQAGAQFGMGVLAASTGLAAANIFGLTLTNTSTASLFATNLSRGSVMWGAGNALANIGIQYSLTGSFGEINVTSVASSFLFKNAFTASVVGSGGGFTFNGGYNGFGVRPLLSLSTEIGIGTVSGLGFNLAHSRIVFTGSALGDFSTGAILGVQFNSLGILIPNAIIKQNELEK
ncbi:MAG: hypothetical protein KJZ55_10330, partial [Flavobacteriales bacterium]|nr:hypothetical protein [Flavobacteriales bacterium]